MEENNKEKEPQKEVKYEYFQVYEGAKFKTLLTRKYQLRQPWVPHDPTQIKSFIPGTIRKVFVKEGQKIKKGDKLCSLEAMKMQNLIFSTLDGTVKSVHVKPGQNVCNKQLLIELEKEKERKKKKK